MVLSRKAKEALKTALAMAITYAIALQMDWDKPMWAGFAVAFVSLSSIGQSLNKAALRMVGTVAGIVVAFVFIALFAQERWAFILWVSLWLGFCTYMMGSARNQYFWHVAGFVCVIICMDAGPDSANAFQIAVLRTQQTGLGILVYTIVSLLLWPTSSGPSLKKSVAGLAATQRELFAAYFGLMTGTGDAVAARALAGGEAQRRGACSQLFESAQTDDYGIWEQRGDWQRYLGLSAELAETIERWRESFVDAPSMDLRGLMPGLEAYGVEIEARLGAVAAMLSGKAPAHSPTDVNLAFDQQAVRHLSHFQRATLVLTHSRLQRLDALSRESYACATALQQDDARAASREIPPFARKLFVPDPDRLISSVRVMATVWLAFLAYIYVDALPGGASVVSFSTSIGMALATLPQLPVSKLYRPVTVGVVIASLAYIFLMPHLSTYLELGVLIFLMTFGFCYHFADPQQMLGRAFGLAMFFAISSIDNEQSYSFLVVANTALMLVPVLFVLGVTANLPVSTRPEDAFARLMRRFFRSCEGLFATLGRDPYRILTVAEQRRQAFHIREISTMPAKLTVWAKFMGPAALKGYTPEQVQAIVASLRSISRCVQEILEEYGQPQSEFLVEEMRSDMHAWRVAVQQAFGRFAEEPAAGGKKVARGSVDVIMDRIETRIAGIVDKAGSGRVSQQEAVNFYRMLGAFRGLSEALVVYAGSAGVIDWRRWREVRFA